VLASTLPSRERSRPKVNRWAEHYILEGVNMNSDNFSQQLLKLEYSKPVISNGMEYDEFSINTPYLLQKRRMRKTRTTMTVLDISW